MYYTGYREVMQGMTKERAVRFMTAYQQNTSYATTKKFLSPEEWRLSVIEALRVIGIAPKHITCGTANAIAVRMEKKAGGKETWTTPFYHSSLNN